MSTQASCARDNTPPAALRRTRHRPGERTPEGTLVILDVIPPALLGPTGAHWLEDPSDLTCQETTGQYAVDDPLLSC
jgi:hypothetical protein